jgi:endonuclease/exonuclease/phosphatase family metal-dependent hydrolase
MRFVLYNIHYATGLKARHFMGPSKRNLKRISSFLQEQDADLVGLVEVDLGSYRAGGRNQARVLAESLGHFHSHGVKYEENSFWSHVRGISNWGPCTIW